MTTELAPITYSFQNMERLAQAVAKSGLFGMKTADEALVLMAIAQAEGIHPALAARDYDIIQKKPALKASAKLSRFQASGGKIEWHESNNERASATFTHPCANKSITIEWNLEKARRAELLGKDMWRKYPDNMLRARVISDGIGAIHPYSNGGLYTPEEVQDIVDTSPLPEQDKLSSSENKISPLATDEVLSCAEDMDKAESLEELQSVWTKWLPRIKISLKNDIDSLTTHKDKTKEILTNKLNKEQIDGEK